MPNINDRIGSQNVIRVLSNASAPPTRIVNLTDVDATLKTRDGMILVWDLPTETFFMTDTIDSSTLVATGIVTFSNTTNSLSPTTGALIVNGGIGVGKNVVVGGGLSITGISTFESDIDVNAAVDILKSLTVNSTFKSVGVTTLTESGGITTTGGNLFVGKNLYVKGTSEFIGVATFRGGTINIGDSTGDDINIGGEFISDLNPNDDASYDIGIDSKRWRNARFSGLVTTNNLFVSGVSTFKSNINIDSSIDIDGHTELDNLNVSGFSTFASNVDINASIDVDGHTELDNLNVSGFSTFASNVDINASIDVDGHTELDNLNVSGVSTFLSDLDINASIDVDGHTELDNLNVSGVSTFLSDLDINASIDVDGHTELDNLNVSGVSTFLSDLDINASVDILDNLVINGTLESVGITTLSSNGGITTTGGDLFTKDNLTVGKNLYVKGTSEFIGVATFRGGTINIGDSTGDDINIGGEFISDLNPNDDATYDIGIDSKRWRNARFSGLVTTNNLFVSGVSTFTNNLDINGDVKITGFASVTEGLYYDSG
jgi:hypothetical protein